MSLRPGFPAVSQAADQFDIRAALRATTAQDANGRIKTGVAITTASMNALVTPAHGMTSAVAPFDATLERYGPVWVSNEGTANVRHDPPPSANSRTDLIYVKQCESAPPASDPEDGPQLAIAKGTPAIDPITPKPPEGALALAAVTIPSTATATTSQNVVYHQLYPYTASAGSPLLFRTQSDMNAWTPWDGQQCSLIDGTKYEGKQGAWVCITPTRTTLLDGRYGTVLGVRSGRVAQLAIAWKSAAAGSWDWGSFGTLPTGWRPVVETIAAYQGRDGSSQRQFRLQCDGTFTYNNMGGAQNAGTFDGGFCYILA